MGTDIALASIIYDVIINILRGDTVKFYKGVSIVDTIYLRNR